jgi:hypothetical protein
MRDSLNACRPLPASSIKVPARFNPNPGACAWPSKGRMLGSKLISTILEGPDSFAANKKLLDVALSTSFSLMKLSYFNQTFRRAA